MKLKKIFYTFLLALSLVILASCNSKKTYSLNVEFDSTKGSVTYTEADKEGKYTEGTDVIITVKPLENFEVESITVNNQPVEFVSNMYIFGISEDTSVVVTFKEKIVEPTSYSVAVNVGDEQAIDYELTYAPEAIDENGKFLNGAEVVLNVSVKENYKLNEIKLNGEAIALVDGKYQFVVTSDVVIEISTVAIDTTFPLSALTSMQTSFDAIGAYHLYYKVSGEEVFASIQATFEENEVHLVEMDLNTGEVTYDQQFVNHNGLCSTPTINLKNEVVYHDSTEPFENYDNPFKDLKVEDFVYVEDGKFELVNKKDETSTCITGWEETIQSFYVYVENGKIVRMEITTGEIKVDDTETYHSIYNFDVMDHNEAKTNIRTEPYEKVAEHTALEQALALVKNNYTVNHRDIWEGEEDIVYNVLVDAKGTYSDYVESGLTYGYVELDGYVYPFSYDGTTVTLSDPIAGYSSSADVQADFSAFDVALLEYVGQDTYVARDSQLAAAIATWVGEDYDTQMLGQYATSLKIILKDGKLYQVIFDYLVYGQAGTVVLTYSKFDETEITIDFTNCVKVSVLDAYIGVWSNADHKIVVTQEGITIDDVEFVVGAYEEGVFYGTVNGVDTYLAKWTENELAVYDKDGNMSYIVSLEQEPVKVVVPEAYKGVWANEEHKIIVQTNVVIVDGEEFVLTGYTEETGLIGKYQGKAYYLVLVDDAQSTELYFTTNDLSEYYAVTKTTETYIEIPESYVGTWKNSDETMVVEITFMGIVINGLPFTIASYDEFYGFTGTYNGVSDYMVAPYYSADTIQIGTMEENYVCTKVVDTPKPPVEITIPEEQYGTYVDAAGEYTVVVNNEKITINDVEYVITEFDEYQGFTGTYNGEVLYLMYVGAYGEDPDTMYIFNEDGTVYIPCARQAGAPSVTINEAHLGTYQGIKNDVTYTIVVTKDAITINEVVFDLKSVSEFGEYEGLYNNATYYLAYTEAYGDSKANFALFNEDYTFYVQCEKVEQTSGVVIPADQFGTYVGKVGETDYQVVISENSITLNGEAFVPSSYSEMEGYVGKVGEETYYVIYMGPWGSYPAQVQVKNADESLNVTCDIVGSDTPTTPTIQASDIGTYEGTKDGVTTTVVITAEKITVNGTDCVLTAYDSYEGYTITYNDAEYFIIIYDGYIMFMNAASYDYVQCDKVVA